MFQMEMKTSADLPAPDPDKRHPSPFNDRALILFYAVLIGIAMGGWLWFLGWLSWEIVTWFVNAIT
jgi:hypothetical protein